MLLLTSDNLGRDPSAVAHQGEFLAGALALSRHVQERECLAQDFALACLALGRGDLLKTIIDRVELRPNGRRMILSLVPLTPAAAPPIHGSTRLSVSCLTPHSFFVAAGARPPEPSISA